MKPSRKKRTSPPHGEPQFAAIEEALPVTASLPTSNPTSLQPENTSELPLEPENLRSIVHFFLVLKKWQSDSKAA